jgi:hypothetical protein
MPAGLSVALATSPQRMASLRTVVNNVRNTLRRDAALGKANRIARRSKGQRNCRRDCRAPHAAFAHSCAGLKSMFRSD